MYDNPWNVDNMARMQRERIPEEMRQIRLEGRALRAYQKKPGLLQRGWLLAQHWLRSRKMRPEPTADIAHFERGL